MLEFLIPACSPGWSFYLDTSNCYVFVNQIGLDLSEAFKPNWTEAQTFCHAFGGELASVPDKGTNDFLAQLTSEEAWIGGHKVEYKIENITVINIRLRWMESGPGVTDHPGSLRIGLQDNQTIMATKIMSKSIGSLLEDGMI